MKSDLEHENDELKRRYYSLKNVLTGFSCAVLIFFGLIAFSLVVRIPYFEEAFADMLKGKLLPRLTQMVLMIHRALGVFSLGLVLIPVVIALIAVIRYGKSTKAWWFALLVMVYLVFVSAAVGLALWLPMMEIIREIQ